MPRPPDDDARRAALRAYAGIAARLRERVPHAAEEIFLPETAVVRTDGLPDWWHARANVFLAPPGVGLPLPSYAGMDPPQNATVVVGPNCHLPNQMIVLGDGPAVFLGPHVGLPNGTIICSGRSMIALAGNTFAINAPSLDARNGGLIYVGDDNLWSSDVKINTDDMHAIFDRRTLRRLNRYGSTVTIGTHVWLGQDVLVNPGVDIRDNAVVGSRSVVTRTIPSGCIAVGLPARVIRRGITWTRTDLPPGSPPLDLGLAPPERALSRLVRRFRRTFAGRRA